MKPIILKLAGVWLASVPALDAATYHVVPPGVGTNPVPNYTSWATAATNIHDVMNRVTHGDTVLVSDGCYPDFRYSRVFPAKRLKINEPFKKSGASQPGRDSCGGDGRGGNR